MADTPNLSLSPEHMQRLVQWRLDRVRFVREALGVEPDECQRVVLVALNTDRRVAWRSGHGVGKTTLSAWMVLHALICMGPCKVLTTASVWRQLDKFLWPEIHKWGRRMNLALVGLDKLPIEWLNMEIRITEDWMAFAAASDDPTMIEGCHADFVFYVMDEAKGIPRGTWLAAKGAMTGKGQILAISTPPEGAEGYFCDIFTGVVRGWTTFHTSAFDSPRVSKEWIEDLRQEYGEESPEYVARVLGDIPSTNTINTVVPMSWTQSAMDRQPDESVDRPRIASLDVARFGDDECVFAVRVGNDVRHMETWHGYPTTTTEDRVWEGCLEWNVSKLIMDEGGLGSGPYDHLVLRSRGRRKDGLDPIDIVGFNFGGSPNELDRYADAGTEAWFALRDMLSPESKYDPICLPRDIELKSQLVTRRFQWQKHGRKLMSKAEMKSKFHVPSPDRADAIVMLYATVRPKDADRRLGAMPQIRPVRFKPMKWSKKLPEYSRGDKMKKIWSNLGL